MKKKNTEVLTDAGKETGLELNTEKTKHLLRTISWDVRL